MCKRCVFMEGKEELLGNTVKAFDNDVVGTENMQVVSVMVNTETSELSIVSFDMETLNNLDGEVDGGTTLETLPHFLHTMPIANDVVLITDIQSAVNNGSVLPDSITTIREVFKYLGELDDKEEYIVVTPGRKDIVRELLHGLVDALTSQD